MEEKEGAFQESLRALTRFIVNDGTLEDTLLRVSHLACAFTPAEYAGITMVGEGSARTAVFTGPEASEVDEAQYRTGEGPGPYALRDEVAYRIDATVADQRWPEFGANVAAHGILSTLSVPLAVRGKRLGVLHLFAASEGAFAPHEERVHAFADQACIVLANAQVYWETHQRSENLSQAIETRETISQAVGILIAVGGRAPKDAFQILVDASQRENRKLREIAEEIVARTVERGAHAGG